MCHHSVLGTILFDVIPFLIYLLLLVLLSLKIFHYKKLNLGWKITLFIVSIFASWVIFNIILSQTVYLLEDLRFFRNMDIWECPGFINGRPVL